MRSSERVMFAIAVAVAIAVLGSTSFAAPAPTSVTVTSSSEILTKAVKAELPSKIVNVTLKKAGARNALTALLNNSGVKYSIAEDVGNETKVNLEYKKTKWSDVFTQLLEQAQLTYQMDGEGVITVTPAARLDLPAEEGSDADTDDDETFDFDAAEDSNSSDAQ